MGRLAEHFRVCLVAVVINVRLYKEFVCQFQCPVDMAYATLVVAVHINGYPLFIQSRRHYTQIRKSINIYGFHFRHLIHIDLFANTGLRRDDFTLGNNKGTCFHVMGR